MLVGGSTTLLRAIFHQVNAQKQTQRETNMTFKLDALKIDAALESEKIAQFVVGHTRDKLRRRGVVVGLSGGIDSAVMASLAVKAMGKDNVFGLIMPEKESNPVSSSYA